MKKFSALLRGINVSGQKIIKMSELKLLFEEMDLQNVQTYIQSGNVIFSSREKVVNNLKAKISSGIKNKFGFDVPVIVINSKEMEYVLKNNPFIQKKKAVEKLYVTFLSETPSVENINKISRNNYSPEEFFIEGKHIYLFLPNGAGKAKLNNNLFENKLKVNSTSRNWKTIQKLSELVSSE